MSNEGAVILRFGADIGIDIFGVSDECQEATMKAMRKAIINIAKARNSGIKPQLEVVWNAKSHYFKEIL